jgi:SAM-dependent methyltransferase
VRGYEASSYGDGIADVYDEWYPSDDATAGAVDRLTELAGAGPVLELGVGTGRLAIPLAARGIEVHGVDASPAMVERLGSKPGGDRVHLVTGDMVDALPAGPFSLVFVAINTFFNLVTQEAQQRCFDAVAERLEPGGRFALEVFVPADPPREGGFVDVRSIEAARVVLTVSQSDPATQVTTGQFVDLVHGEPVRLRPFQIRWATPAQLDAMAAAAGLELEQRTAGWLGEPFGPDSAVHLSIYRRGGAR